MITQERLKQALFYNPNSGIFIWRWRQSYPKHTGKIAGSYERKGYLNIQIDGKNYKAHRLAWLYMTGMWPCEQIDHINTVKDDNRLVNLREATNSQNRANTPPPKNGSSGLKGAQKTRNKWQAMIAGRYLGIFDSQEKAHAAYAAKAKELFGDFARTS